MDITLKDRLLLVSFDKPQSTLSWAIHGGGKRMAKAVAWVQVKSEELKPPVDAREFLKHRLKENGVLDAVGMLTSADLNSYISIKKSRGKLSANCIASVGMDNALRVGDSASVRAKSKTTVGTINLLCLLSAPLSEEAHLEALSIAVEARTAACLEANILSIQSGFPATGTGTDCVVITAPSPIRVSSSNIARYAGKHTSLGSLIGQSVFSAVSKGLRAALITLIFILVANTKSWANAELTEISDRQYLPKILELIRNSNQSIDISMYQILLGAEDTPTHPVRQILDALAKASQRGVKIRIVLNRYLDYAGGESVPVARSLAAWEFLVQSGIEVLFAHPSRRLHDKVIVIDNRWVIEGSTNWTRTALESNWESATLIDSQVYAAAKTALAPHSSLRGAAPRGRPQQEHGPAQGPAPTFDLPLSYFTYNLSARLSFAAEFFYLLARLEMSQSPASPWWWRSEAYLSQKYHVHHTTLAAGMLELQRENLIEIVRDDAPEGRPHSERSGSDCRHSQLDEGLQTRGARSRLHASFPL